MIEYRVERVNPSYESSIVEALSTFGWQLVSSQEIYNESNEITGVDVTSYGSFMQGFTGKDGKINVRQHKTVTNYVVLKFSRDTEMPQYNRLKELNEDFESRLNYPEPKKPVKRTAVMAIGMAIIIISVILALVEHNTAELWEIIVCVVFPILMIPLTVLGWVRYKRDKNVYDYNEEKMWEVYEQARELNTLNANF